MAERVIMDPAEGGSGLTEFELSDWIKADGVDWGDAAIAAYMADFTYGSAPVDYRVPNRNISIPLVLRTRTGTSFDQVRTYVQAKVSRWQQEGGVLKRVTSAGGTVFADVVTANLHEGGGWSQAFKDYDIDSTLTIEALPDWYENEIALPDHVETSATEITFTETNIRGDYPARVRWVVDEDQGQNQLGLMWCTRSKNYTAGSTGALSYEAEALTPLDTAARAALSGASGGTVVTHGTLSTGWTPVLSTNMPTGVFLTHQGTYRWLARYRTTSGTAVSMRGVYDVGDLVAPTENDAWYHPAGTAGTAFYIADLGEIRLEPAPIGTHRWQGQIQARGVVGSAENISIDKIWFQCLDESAGILRAPLSTAIGLTAYSARDEFNHTAGSLSGKTLPVGGVWGSAGDTNDFSVSGSPDFVAQRVAIFDTGVIGRVATASAPSLTNTAVQVDVNRAPLTVPVSSQAGGVIARYSSSTSFVYAAMQALYDTAGQPPRANVFVMKLSPSEALLGQTDYQPAALFDSLYWSIRLVVDATGRWYVWVFEQGSQPGRPVLQGVDLALATGGALASGTVGMIDRNGQTTGTLTRSYDNFLAWVPSQDAVAFASQSAQLGTSGMFREDSTGVGYGPVALVDGDLPRLPVSGREQRTVQVMIKPSRGDFAAQPDLGIDDASAQGNYRPCWLYVPTRRDVPENITGLELWLRAEDIPASGFVSSWHDSSPYGRDAVQTTPGNQPVVLASVLDGYRALDFDGTDDLLSVPGFLNNRAARTIFIVVQADVLSSGKAAWGWATTSCIRPDGVSGWRYVTNQAGGSTDLGGGTPLSPRLVTVRYNSTSSADGYINGGAALNLDPSDGYQSGSTALAIGNEAANTRPLDGKVLEVAAFSLALADTPLDQMRGYFSRKFPTLGSFGT